MGRKLLVVSEISLALVLLASSGLMLRSLNNLLHASHFPGCEPDLDATRVEGGCREDVFHDTTGELSAPLILLLRDVHPQP